MTNSEKSIIQDILKVYSVVLLIAVYISSFAFLSLILFIFAKFVKFNIEFFHIIVFSCLSFILFTKIKNKKVKKFGYHLGKILTIFVSIFILFLFLNSYLKISNNIDQFFTVFLNAFEIFVNRFALGMLFPIGSILLYVYFASLLLRFVLNIAQRVGRFIKIISGLIIIFIIILPFLYFLNKSSLLALNDLFYSNFSWFFGFSLISLHLSYIFKEIKTMINSHIAHASSAVDTMSN